jgi:hypothetical protein
VGIPDRRVPGFALVYIPFGLLLVAACLAAEASSQPTLRRAVFTIWLTVATATPAMVLAGVYDLRTAPWPVYAWWRRLWTFAYAAFVIHLGFGHVFFEWDLADILKHQGRLVAGSNYLLAALWTAEMALVWCGARRESRGLYVFQCGTHLFMAGLVFTTTVLLHTGTVRVIGLVFTAAVVGSLLLRFVLGAVPPRALVPDPQP